MTVKQCVLMQHGLLIGKNKQFGTCCYNHKDPRHNTNYDVDPIFCRPCLDQERNGIYSYREGMNQKYGLEHNHRLPIVIDFVPNKSCNLACKICSEYSSSSWAKLKKIKIPVNYNTSVNGVEQQLSHFDLSQVREINFTGGEPFLNNNIARYINQLETKINFSECSLRFVSNGTLKLTKPISNLFEKFKLVSAKFSFDDIGAGHEYQRPPSLWDQVELNWKYFLDHMPHNTTVAINRTVSVLNINRLNLLDQWHALNYQYSKFQDKIELIDHFANGPYNIDSVTAGLKQMILDRHGTNSRAWSYIKDRPISNNIEGLKTTIRQHDALHGTDIQQFDPDLYRVLFS